MVLNPGFTLANNVRPYKILPENPADFLKFLAHPTILLNNHNNLRIRVALCFSLWYNGGIETQQIVFDGEFQNKTKVTEFDFEAFHFV